MLVTRWFTRCQRKINHLELRAMISAPLWSRVGSSLFEMFEPVYPVDCGSAQFALIGPYYHHRGVYFRWQFNAFSKHRHPKKTRAINLNMQINLQTPTGQDHQSKWRCIRFYVCFQTLGSFSTVCASGCTGCGRSINENDIGGQPGWQTRVNQDPFTVEWTGYSRQKNTGECQCPSYVGTSYSMVSRSRDDLYSWQNQLPRFKNATPSTAARKIQDKPTRTMLRACWSWSPALYWVKIGILIPEWTRFNSKATFGESTEWTLRNVPSFCYTSVTECFPFWFIEQRPDSHHCWFMFSI